MGDTEKLEASGRILLIEDDPSGREMALFNLRKAGYEAETAESGENGLALFSKEKHDLVITDVRMPGISGIDVLKEIRKRSADVPVLVITAFGNIEMAVEAMKAGAFDFIGKPFNREHLLLTVGKALESRRLKEEVRTLRIRATGIERPIVHKSTAMKEILDVADRVATSEATVLITGETGTGKELVARRIHAKSERAEGSFVAVNCAAIPTELLESELFGHEKGAFTGAAKARSGRFRQANKGTIFLDEVSELPLAVQAKLLRVLQERVVDVVGIDRPVSVDVRVIAATNQELPSLVGEGAFREDLYYRLHVVEIRVPALRDRKQDIKPLAYHFVEQFSRDRELDIPDELIATLFDRAWPGNVRELFTSLPMRVTSPPRTRSRATHAPMICPSCPASRSPIRPSPLWA